MKKDKLPRKLLDLGLKSSYAYAPEQVKDKDKMGWNKLKFWQKNRHSAEDKLRLGTRLRRKGHERERHPGYN